MKKLLFKGIAIFALILTIQSCNKDECKDVTCPDGQTCVDGNCVDNNASGNEIVSSNITGEVTWTSDKVWQLAGRIFVEDGATLTIEPGTIIKGEAGSGANATALVVARGGVLLAEGSPEAPIIFTTVADEIQPGQIASPNMDPTLQGLWGGLIVLGKAPSSFAGNVQELSIEGIPASDDKGKYGGSDENDYSGKLRYISIRHGGSNIGEGNEINGLTLGGVGRDTEIEYIEVVGNADDGIEWFGGTVDVNHALVWNSGDDALDTDQSWAGTLDNFVIVCGDNTDHALEIDGPEGSFNAAHTIKNGTVKGNEASELADFRDCARGTFENIYFFDFESPAESGGRGDFSLSNPEDDLGNEISSCTTDNFDNSILNFANLEITLASGADLDDVFKGGTDVHATSVAEGANTVGADVSKFANWTWASQAGALNF